MGLGGGVTEVARDLQLGPDDGSSRDELVLTIFKGVSIDVGHPQPVSGVGVIPVSYIRLSFRFVRFSDFAQAFLRRGRRARARRTSPRRELFVIVPRQFQAVTQRRFVR